MKAAVNTTYGPPEVVRVSEVAAPTAAGSELLVRVHATTVNRTDCGYRAGHPWFLRFFSGLLRPKATILGNEFAGEVAAVGPDVTSFAVGDRVFGYCEGRFGAHAEYLTVAEDGTVATIPRDATYEQVAPATEGSHYARSFIRAADVHAGQRVLVHGATGAIGSAAVQLLAHLGAHVTATAPTAHVPLVERLGAERVVDHTAVDFTRDDHTYDVVMDAVGKSSYRACERLLAPDGIYLSSDLGPWSQNPLLALVTRLRRGGKRVMFPTPRDDPEMAAYFGDLIETGAFTPVIDRHYPLDEIVEAYRYVETGEKVGNVVIDVVAADRS